MDKLDYLVKTLSRTRRKDYENYVVNAVWNRLGNPEIQPVSQQYVARPEDGAEGGAVGYFIDLYFPQLSVGFECDEANCDITVTHSGIKRWHRPSMLARSILGDGTNSTSKGT